MAVSVCQSHEDVMQRFYDCAEKDDQLTTEIVLNFVNTAVHRQLGKLDGETLLHIKSHYARTDDTLFAALVLVNKFRMLNPKPSIYYEFTATDLLIVATLAALKFLEDPDSEEAMTNQMWSECVNIELEDLNKMEVDFYRALDWNLFVSLAEFEAFITEALISPLQSHIEIRSPPKGRLQRSVKRKSHALIQSKDRDKELVFSRLPSAKSMALAATAILTLSCSASLLYRHPTDSRIVFADLRCHLPEAAIEYLNTTAKSNATLPSPLYIPTSRKNFDPSSFLFRSACIPGNCAAEVKSTQFVKRPSPYNSSLPLIPLGVS